VRVHAVHDANPSSTRLENPANVPLSEPARAAVSRTERREQRLGENAWNPPRVEIHAERFSGRSRKWHHPLLAALAHDPHLAPVKIHVADVESGGLTDPQTRPVEKLHQCAIAQCPPIRTFAVGAGIG